MTFPGGGDDDGGMMDLETYEAIVAEDAANEAPAAPEDPDALPSVAAERRAELKDKARAMIEERLKAKRKQRRLMRGGNL